MSTGSFIKINEHDNVATCIKDAPAGTNVCGVTQTLEDITFGFKAALTDISKGSDIIKYGVVIGYARSDIKAGECVHIHNISSFFDSRTCSFNRASGAPQDMRYEL